MNFLHLALDEKFIPFAAKVFEAAFPGRSQYRIADPGRAGPRFVSPGANLRLVPLRYWQSAAMREEVAQCDCLVVHYMTPWFARAVLAAPPHVAVMWGAWGGDYYHLLPDFSERLHLPETARLVAELRRRRRWRFGSPADMLSAAVVRIFTPPVWDQRALGRIDAATMLPEEHRMLAAAHPEFRARYHLMHYYGAEDILMQGPAQVRGDDILLGNAAFPNNNHLEALAMLRSLELGERRIVAPLSYGDEHYAQAICRAGERAFGARFVPLRRFMPLGEFNEVLSTCSIVVMNHVRQQAFGTINAAMVKGAKVYLRPENPLQGFYRGIGARVFELPGGVAAGNGSSSGFFSPLQSGEARANRDALLSFCSFESAVQAVRGLGRIVADKRNGGNSGNSGNSVPHV